MKVITEKTLDIDMPPAELCKRVMGSDKYELISLQNYFQKTDYPLNSTQLKKNRSKNIVHLKLREKK